VDLNIIIYINIKHQLMVDGITAMSCRKSQRPDDALATRIVPPPTAGTLPVHNLLNRSDVRMSTSMQKAFLFTKFSNFVLEDSNDQQDTGTFLNRVLK